MVCYLYLCVNCIVVCLQSIGLTAAGWPTMRYRCGHHKGPYFETTRNGHTMSSHHEIPSYLTPHGLGPWGVYLEQIDRVTPHLGSLARWVETLKRPKRVLIVDVPIERDDGTIAHFEGYRVQHN